MTKQDDNWKTSADYLYSSKDSDGDDEFVIYRVGNEEKRQLLQQRLAELHVVIEKLSQELYELEQRGERGNKR